MPIQELCGTCAVISAAEALACKGISRSDFMKLMTCINHYADLADDEFMPRALEDARILMDREKMPGNKDVKEIIEGIKIFMGQLPKEHQINLHQFIKNDIALAVAVEYDYQEKKEKQKHYLF